MRLDDADRLESIRELRLVDSPAEDSFDRVTRLASRLLDAPVSLVSIVTPQRQFFKSSIGLPEPWNSRRETPLSHSFCQYVVRDEAPLVVTDAREHDLVRDNLAIRDLDVIAYCGVPIRDQEGRVLGSFCVIDDDPREWTDEEIALVSDLVEIVHDELRLRALLRERGEALEDFKNLLATIAHDLRGPLTGAAGAIELLQARGDELPPDKHAQLLTMAGSATRRASRMADELVDSQRPTAVGPVDVRELLDRAVATAVAALPALEARIRVVEGEPVPMVAPSDDLERIVGNLVNNAVAHAGPAATVSLAARREGDTVTIEVADDGIGMSVEELEDLRQPFRRGTEAEGRPGIGLGLHIVWSLTGRLGGTLAVDTAPGEGTRFMVTLPAAGPDPTPAPQPDVASPQG